MKKRDDGYLRYEVRLVKPDGSERILEHEATAHRCRIIDNRYNKTVRLGRNDGATLRFRISKVLLTDFH
jgi:hypothetical protein